jgi:hypothetical protein
MRRLLSRYTIFHLVITLTVLSAALALAADAGWWVPCAFFGALTVVGINDMRQTRHAIRRN